MDQDPNEIKSIVRREKKRSKKERITIQVRGNRKFPRLNLTLTPIKNIKSAFL
jgi:hypothetical protein